MPRYWVIAPFENSPEFDKVWQFDLSNKVISIGWAPLGDVSKMSRDELDSTVASSEYRGKPPQVQSLIANILWNFYRGIAPGDFVIARRGRKTLAAVGKVIQPAIYSPGKNPYNHHPNFLGVEWQEQPRDRAFPDLVFPMQTLTEISEPQYRNLVEGPASVVPPVSRNPLKRPRTRKQPKTSRPLCWRSTWRSSSSLTSIRSSKET